MTYDSARYRKDSPDSVSQGHALYRLLPCSGLNIASGDVKMSHVASEPGLFHDVTLRRDIAADDVVMQCRIVHEAEQKRECKTHSRDM